MEGGHDLDMGGGDWCRGVGVFVVGMRGILGGTGGGSKSWGRWLAGAKGGGWKVGRNGARGAVPACAVVREMWCRCAEFTGGIA
eukprot:6840919-Prorocentrum_lima.AAC.1